MTTATAARALLLALAATAWPATAQEAQPFAAPGRAGAAPPAAADPVAGRPMRVGFAVPPGAAAAPPAMFRVFLDRPAAAPAPCLDAARRLVATSGRGVGTRELTGPLVVAFGADATATVVDPALRLGPAGLAGLARLPGAPTRLALDPVGQRLFVASAAPPAMAVVDLATRRGGAVLSLDAPAAGIAWDAAGDALFVLAGDGALAAHDPETLQPRAASARIAGAEALAVVGRERLVAVAGAEAGLRILDAASLDPLHGLDLPAGGAGPVRLAAAEDDAAVFVSSGRAAFAVEARSGRRLARFDLAVPAKALLPLLSGQAAAPLADGSVVVLDAAVGALLEVVPAGADVAEAALAGSTLYLRGEATPRLALLDAARLRPGRHPAPASAEAGARPFGPAALPLLAPFGEAMLVANPGERRTYLHHGMGMAAPRAAFAAGGSPLVAIAALAREPARTAAARVELTAEAPAAGRWRLVFALPEQGRAVCHDLFVAPGAPA